MAPRGSPTLKTAREHGWTFGKPSLTEPLSGAVRKLIKFHQLESTAKWKESMRAVPNGPQGSLGVLDEPCVTKR